MFKTIQTAALSLAVVLGGFAVAPSVAQAGSLHITVAPEAVQYRYERERPRVRGRECTANRAVEKAWKLGINRPRVTRVARNTIAVRGYQRGERVRIVFARAPNCPVIR
ncbi:hypothetical protein [Tianweitania sediminis]|uniref:Antifreeze protein n=1 Tax=Tianweitania sediminis TaxID=1502156 RepID=A0A8J7RJM1_9HYPH|nr:hypothetical protein [Tianweitania sediminis]MBP0438471.1 hypothetical protein [Tianweitania sediminis]